jgi:hypothetical protein
MEHSFNIELASKYGVEEAVVIQNLFFWINKNVANDKNFYDGRYWTYNSAKAFAKLFPYLNESKLFRILKSLQDDDIIIKGNYNKEKFDRTGWYTFTDNGISILEKLDFHFSKMQNGFSENKETIPDNKQQIINTDIKESTYVDKKKTKNEEEITNEDYRKLRIWMNENCPYCNNPRNMPSSTITQAEFLKLKSEYSGRDIAETILEIENRKDLRKKYANLYRTTLNWLKNRNK